MASDSMTVERRPRKAPRAVRRRQILEATIDSISRVGFADTTLASVARIAGISQASLIFHFKTKDALLVETLRHLAEEYQTIWQAALAAAPSDPLARICALVTADFDPVLCSRKKVSVWQAFWGEAKSRPIYMRICGERAEERDAVMAEACRALLSALGRPEDEAGTVAAVIDGLCDGLWQSLLLEPGAFSRRDGLRLMFFQLATLFPERTAEIGTQADRLWRSKGPRTRPKNDG